MLFPFDLKKIRKPIPNLEAINLLEYLLISSVSSLLLIRAYLAVFGYPVIGSGNFHIAHMLWGGFFMLGAIILLLSFLDSTNKIWAAVLGGIGFGTFIDELGKFITSDNNYFYQPTIALIYVIFILLYLLIKWISSKTTYPDKVYAANAVEMLKEIVTQDFDQNEKALSTEYLNHLDQRNPVIKSITKIISETGIQRSAFSLHLYLKNTTFKWYLKIVQIKIISKLLIVAFVLNNLVSFIYIDVPFLNSRNGTFSIINYGHLFSVLTATIFLVGGIYYFKKSTLKSYIYLENATLVSIFLTQFFLFLNNQLFALLNLAVYLVIYTTLKYSIDAEKALLSTKN